MNVLIHFDADNRDEPSTLYIRSRVKRDGQAKEWMFRVSRTRLEIER